MTQIVTSKGVIINFDKDGTVSLKGPPAWTRTIRTRLRLLRTNRGYRFNPLRSSPEEYRQALIEARIPFTYYGD